MNSNQLEELIRNIQAMIKCPNCGSPYKKENINFLGQMGQAVLVQLNCYVCKMPIMATIVVSDSGKLPGAKEMKSLSRSISQDFIDISKDKLDTDKPVSSDEILELHEFLDDFAGDFRNLFSKPS